MKPPVIEPGDDKRREENEGGKYKIREVKWSKVANIMTENFLIDDIRRQQFSQCC